MEDAKMQTIVISCLKVRTKNFLSADGIPFLKVTVVYLNLDLKRVIVPASIRQLLKVKFMVVLISFRIANSVYIFLNLLTLSSGDKFRNY